MSPSNSHKSFRDGDDYFIKSVPAFYYTDMRAIFPSLLKKMPDVKLLIVGDGPDRSHLERKAEKLHLKDNIIFSGRVPVK